MVKSVLSASSARDLSQTTLTFGAPATPYTDAGDLAGRVLRRSRFFGGSSIFLQETEHLEVRRAKRVLRPTQLFSQSWPSPISLVCTDFESAFSSPRSLLRLAHVMKRNEPIEIPQTLAARVVSALGTLLGEKDRLTSVPRNQATTPREPLRRFLHGLVATFGRREVIEF